MKILKTSIVFLTTSALLQQTVFAAEVKEIRKQRKVAVINEGETQGVTKGTKYCFSDPNGKKVGCGKVVRVMKDAASVMINNPKALNKILPGYTATAEGGGKEGGNEKTAGSNGKSKFMAIRGLFLPGLTPFSYNKLAYVAPTDGATGIEALWKSDGTQNKSLIAFGGEIDLLSFGVAVGFKLRPINGFQTEEDFIIKNGTKEYIVNTLTGSNFGFYGDYYFIRTGSTSNGLRIGAGLDIDMSTINVKVLKTSEDGSTPDEDIYEAKSSLTAISVRAPISYDLTLGTLGLNFGANLLIPLAGTAALSFTTTDPNIAKYNDADNEGVAQSDFAVALGHKKNSFGFEAVIGAYVAF